MFNLPATEHHIKRERKLLDYIDQHRDEIIKSTGSDKLIYLARHYWTFLKMRVYSSSNQILEVPDCCPNSDCSIFMFTWDKNEHYLECEIISDGSKEFFYKNRFTREVWGEDYLPKVDISDYILDKLLLFTE